MRKKWLIVFGVIIFGIFVFSIWQAREKAPAPTPSLLKEAIPTIAPSLTPPAVVLEPVTSEKILPQTNHAYQTFNNCGPANLSMILSFYGIKKTQKEIADEIRPIQHPKGKNDDKTIFPTEMVDYLKKYDLEAKLRVNGDIDLLKIFISNNIPVIVGTWLKKRSGC